VSYLGTVFEGYLSEGFLSQSLGTTRKKIFAVVIGDKAGKIFRVGYMTFRKKNFPKYRRAE
jgi:hypothetical protein